MELREIITDLFMEKAAVNEVCHGIASDETTKRALLEKLEANARNVITSNFDLITELSVRQLDGGDAADLFSSDMSEDGTMAYETDDDDSDILEQMMSLEQQK